MELRALGPLVGIDRAGAPVDLGGRRQLMVLAMLLVGVNEPVSVDRLTLGVWGDDPPARVRHTLQAYISELRKLVPGGIERQSEAYLLRLPAEAFDVIRFEALVADARSRGDSDPHRALESVSEALRIWRGTPYDGLGDNDDLNAERSRLEHLRATAGATEVRLHDATGSHDRAAEAGLQWIREAPFDEAIVRLTATALYRAGRQADALRAISDLRSRLGEELGLEPSPHTVGLEDRMLSHDDALAKPVPAARPPRPAAGPEEIDVIGLAHLVDVPLRPSTIATALGCREADVIPVVERLAARGDLIETTAGVLERAGAGDVVGPTRAMSLAGRLADALAHLDRDPATVGRLLHRAGRGSEAADLLAEAAQRATTPAETVSLAELALEVSPPDDGSRGILHFLLASRLREMGESVSATDHVRFATGLLDGEEKVDALGFASVLADDLQSASVGEMWAALGQVHAQACGQSAKAASLRTLQGRHLVRLGAGAAGDHALWSGGAVVEEVGGPTQRYHALLNRTWAAFDRGDLRQALTGFEALRDHARIRSGRVGEAPHLAAWSRTAWLAGLGREAEDAAAEAEEIGAENDLASVRFLGALGRAEGSVAAVGSLARDAVEAVDLLAEKFLPVWQNRTAYLVGRVDASDGNAPRAGEAFARARSLTPRGQDGERLRRTIDAHDPSVAPDRHVVNEMMDAHWWGIAGRMLVRMGDAESSLDALSLARKLGDPFLALDAVAAGDIWERPEAAVCGRMVRAVTMPRWAEAAWETRTEVSRAQRLADAAGAGPLLEERAAALIG